VIWQNAKMVIILATNIYFDIFLKIAFYLAFQTPTVVAHLAGYTPLGSDRLIKLFAALVKYFLSYGWSITLTFGLRATRLPTTSSGANFIGSGHLFQIATVIGRLSWLIIKTKNKLDTLFNTNMFRIWSLYNQKYRQFIY